MPRYKITTLSPIHIGSGEECEINYNMLYRDGFVYIYDEFKIAEFFISKNIAIPSNLDNLKKNIQKFKDEIIASNLHKRKIASSFSSLNKPLFEQVATQNNPIVTGSSIKGAIRTAILDSMTNKTLKWDRITDDFINKNFDEQRFQNHQGKNIEAFDKDLAKLFKYLKISDSLSNIDTRVYQSINIKKDEDHQSNREDKTKQLINFVESIKLNQIFEIIIDDTSDNESFRSIGMVCNKFYIPWYQDETKNYFKASTKATKDTFEKLKKLDNNCFLLNIGRFGGAERKSINNLRYIKNSKADDKSTTSARTYALEKPATDTVYFEKELLPFGWVLCEKINNGVNQ